MVVKAISKAAANRLAGIGRMSSSLEGCLEGALTDGTVDGFTGAAVTKSGRLTAAYLAPVATAVAEVAVEAPEVVEEPVDGPRPTTEDDIRPIGLVWDCIHAHPGAWDAFVRRYAPLILAIARRSLRARGLSPAPDDLEDICENTFLALVKDDFALLRSYDDRFALSTFLGVVARTQAGRFARRRRVGGSDVDVAELPSRVDDPAVAVEEGDLRAALRETLDEMPDRDRQILQLFYFSDRDYRAIAVELKISANSVGAALHRARERLKARLEARDRRGNPQQ